MISVTSYDKGHLRELASMVSHAAFKKLSTSTNQSSYIRRMKRYTGWEQMTADQPKRLGDLIAHTYQILEQNYRHEYLYKNKLLNDYVLKHYALDDTILLNEFRVGDSIADIVLVNGANKVFEIKTELDTPERLKTQLDDYYKAFTEVYVFTHTTLADKYLSILPPYVGLLLYTASGSVYELRKAIPRTESLDTTFMMASLRKAEYTKLTKNLAGFIPEATPAFYYRSCLEVLYQFPVKQVQQAYCSILKQRIDFQINTYVSEGEVPSYMNFSFYQSRFNKKMYLTMISNLSKNLL
ncbi:sce7726 family protein [Sphingobacterium faecale]|uniref:Sce7726 family protein n=1 Tax=Sphingobacterium faecale TaxID=2803775 RepID=A0ABS1RA57_9SPHI|nr:sce7726 family protein [Sphingobacterium faecale]MBL1411571.1 sce7726 family protein [Sphingobacterium faecale]